ncbi:MAG: hypothetical protein R2695_12170 [Acidimicrobiales bacterium]
MRPPGRTTRASSAKKPRSSTRLRSAKPQVAASAVASRNGSRRMSPWTSGASVRAAANMPSEVDTDRPEPVTARLRGEVTRTAGEIEDRRSRRDVGAARALRRHRHVEAEGHHPFTRS